MCAAREGRDLLSRMLRIDPDERISVDDALRHPYVNSWWDEEEVNAAPPTAYNHRVEIGERTVDEWKRMFVQS
jgi:c-Jun N-terminal kinase